MKVRFNRRQAAHLWLSRIIDDLDPEDFSLKELIAEFGAASGSSDPDKSDVNGEKYLRNQVARLVEDGHIEKIAKGRYQVTDAGKSFRDRYSEED